VAYVDWKLRGPQISTCNCDWGCPCQFNAPPSYGNCRTAVAMHIDAGHFGALPLDGLKWVSILAWPGAIHAGNGEAVAIIDERASEEQRTALLTILSGREQEPGATYFSVLSSTIARANRPLFRPIAFEADVAAGTGGFSVAGIVEARAEPIRNPVTGVLHRVRVAIARGFEFAEAEFASSTTRASGAIPLDWAGRHAHLAIIDIGPYGPVRIASA
jgi:hypothetical protein